MRYPLSIICLTLMTMSCTTSNPPVPFREDPLIGKIVNARTGQSISFSDLMNRISIYDVVYLSEKHDNPMHHAIQHRIIQYLVDSGRAPVIGFEFFAISDTPLLLNFIDSKASGHPEKMERAFEARMRETLGWNDQSDAMWGYYWDLLTLARNNTLQTVGLDLSSAQKRRITRKGMQGLSPVEARQLFSTGLSDPVYKAHMTSIFKRVHCGMDHGGMATKLYDTWVARNDRMALSVSRIHQGIQASEKEGHQKKPGPVVVIMGSGHTEYGLGVVDRLAHISPEITQVNLAMTEISRTPAGLETYLRPLDLEGFPRTVPADYLWFTQRTSYADPCERFRKTLERMKKRTGDKEQDRD